MLRITLASFALLLAACGSDGQVLERSAAEAQLTDRNWIDVWPESADEQLNVLRFTPSMGGGVYQDRTVFEGRFELFRYRLGEDHIHFDFPGREEHHDTEYRIEAVDGPAPFTHRLVLEDSPRGPDVYYGWDERRTASPLGLRSAL